MKLLFCFRFHNIIWFDYKLIGLLISKMTKYIYNNQPTNQPINEFVSINWVELDYLIQFTNKSLWV